MRRNAMCSLVLAAGVFLVASSISAHHGVAHYDMKKTIVLTGTITAFDWGNPIAWSTWTLWMIRGTSGIGRWKCLQHLPCPGGAGSKRPLSGEIR